MEQTISVIVPVYNCGEYLKKCVKSIFSQTYPYIQLILVDDGSTDGSGEMCDAFAARDTRIEVIHQENQGVSAARNAGIRLAKGKYLTFVDADDALVPQALETALEVLHQQRADVVTYGWNKIQGDSVIAQSFGESTVTEDIPGAVKEILTHYSAYGGGYPWNKLWRTDAFDGEFPSFNPDLYYFEDLEWVVRMLLRVQKIAVCPERLYNYYLRENSITRSPEKAEHRELGYHHSVEKIIEDLSTLPELQTWFAEKYYPEIVNGVIHARRHNYQILQTYLMKKMIQIQEDILASTSVSRKIKLRCRILILINMLHVM